jgi:hypothetical protein
VTHVIAKDIRASSACALRNGLISLVLLFNLGERINLASKASLRNESVD